MNHYISDGKKLLNVEYDVQPQLNDTLDGMLIISTDTNGEDYALFMLEPDGNVCCFVLDEVFIVGRVSGIETLVEAVQAWNDGEI